MCMLIEMIRQRKRLIMEEREIMINESVFKRQEVMGSRAPVEDQTLIGRGSLSQL